MPPPVVSVSELNREARRCLEQQFPLLWVGGEISNLVRAASGHCYFSLKDSQSQVRCAMFRARAQLLPWKLENGQQVEVQALVTLYEARGEFQLNIESMRRAGIGQLYERFLQLRDRLAAEGLFASERKRALPPYPRRVGIVSSPQAAALRDVIAAFRRRAPGVELILYPSLVQGAEAPAALLAALDNAYARQECDLLLIVRGGGSLEDLWAFNDEGVARRIAAAPIPTIAGIGHETDTTIADYVADMRAATPTAAAEIASAGWFEARDMVDGLTQALHRNIDRRIAAQVQAVDRLALRLVHPAQRLAASRQRLELLAHRLPAALRQRLDFSLPERLAQRFDAALGRQLGRYRDRLARHAGALAALSPQSTLERGYSIVRSADGAIIRDARQLAAGDALQLQFAVGHASATVESSDL